MVCFMEMLFLLPALARFAPSTVAMTCATAVGHDAPTHADLDLSVKYQEVYPFVSHGDEQAGGEFSGSLEQPMGLTQASSHGCGWGCWCCTRKGLAARTRCVDEARRKQGGFVILEY